MDLYQRLGVAKTATEPEIKKAYRSLAKQLHPDRNTDNPKAAERFSAVTQAYDLLSDPDKRGRYDRGEIDEDGNPKSMFGGGGGGRPNPGGGFAGADNADLGDIFEGLFGRGGPGGGGMGGGGMGGGGMGGRGMGGGARRPPPPPQKGADVGYRLAVPFADAATLKDQRVTLSGARSIDIKLPRGVEDGAKIRLTGQGEQGPAGPGDAIITISISAHRAFTRDGDDIRLDLPVTLGEAVTGAKVRVPTVDGPVMLTVPAGTTSGKVFRLRERGFTRRDGTRGDQFVQAMVDVPAGDPALQAFVQTWAGGGDPRAHLGL